MKANRQAPQPGGFFMHPLIRGLSSLPTTRTFVGYNKAIALYGLMLRTSTVALQQPYSLLFLHTISKPLCLSFQTPSFPW